VILHLIGKQIDTEDLPILFEPAISEEALKKDWTVHASEWHAEDGWLVGMNRENSAGMMVSRDDFFGDVALEFDARTIPPCTHDVDCMWNGSWDSVTGMRGTAYVAGLQGWWTGKAGIEKSPEYKMNACTPLFKLEPGRVYHVIAGSAEGHCFLAVDGLLLIEVTDPEPINAAKHGKIGFEAYCSMFAVRNIKVKKVRWASELMQYAPEF
jgi:hypothetical protein